MRNPGGYAVLTSPSKLVEADTFTCIHCNRIVFVKPRASAAESGGWCCLCNKAICPTCIGKPCDPFEKKLKRMEDRGRFNRQFERVSR
jgi:hypothetical protein